MVITYYLISTWLVVGMYEKTPLSCHPLKYELTNSLGENVKLNEKSVFSYSDIKFLCSLE